MIGLKIEITDDLAKIAAAADKASVRGLQRAAFSIRQEAVSSIETSPDPAPAGQPIHTRRGLARRAIRYSVDKRARKAVIGFRAAVVGQAIAAHEHGGRYKGQRFPKRPVMGPALDHTAGRLAGNWQGTVN